MIHLWEADILEVLPQPRLQLHFLITYSHIVVRTALDTQAGQRERAKKETGNQTGGDRWYQEEKNFDEILPALYFCLLRALCTFSLKLPGSFSSSV